MAGLPLALAVTHFPQAVYLRLFGTKDLGLVFGLDFFFLICFHYLLMCFFLVLFYNVS